MIEIYWLVCILFFASLCQAANPVLSIDSTVKSIVSGNTVKFTFDYPEPLSIGDVFVFTPLGPQGYNIFNIIGNSCVDGSGKPVLGIDRMTHSGVKMYNLVSVSAVSKVHCTFSAKLSYSGSESTLNDSNQNYSISITSAFTEPLFFDWSNLIHRAFIDFSIRDPIPTENNIYLVKLTINSGNLPVSNSTFEMRLGREDIRTQIVETKYTSLFLTPVISEDCVDSDGLTVGIFSAINMSPNDHLDYVFLATTTSHSTKLECVFELYRPYSDYTEITLLKSSISDVTTSSSSLTTHLHFLNPHLVSVKSFSEAVFTQVDFLASENYNQTTSNKQPQCFLVKGLKTDVATEASIKEYYSLNELSSPEYNRDKDEWKIVIGGEVQKYKLFSNAKVSSVEWTLCNYSLANGPKMTAEASSTSLGSFDKTGKLNIYLYSDFISGLVNNKQTKSNTKVAPLNTNGYTSYDDPIVIQLDRFRLHSLDYADTTPFTISIPLPFILASNSPPLRYWCVDSGAKYGVGRTEVELLPEDATMGSPTESTVYISKLVPDQYNLHVSINSNSNAIYHRVRCEIYGIWNESEIPLDPRDVLINGFAVKTNVNVHSEPASSIENHVKSTSTSTSTSTSVEMKTLATPIITISPFIHRTRTLLLSFDDITVGSPTDNTNSLTHTYSIKAEFPSGQVGLTSVDCYMKPPVLRDIESSYKITDETIDITFTFEDQDFDKVHHMSVICQLNIDITFINDLPYVISDITSENPVQVGSGKFQLGQEISSSHNAAIKYDMKSADMMRFREEIALSYKQDISQVSEAFDAWDVKTNLPLSRIKIPSIINGDYTAVPYITIASDIDQPSILEPVEYRIIHGNDPNMLNIFIFSDHAYSNNVIFTAIRVHGLTDTVPFDVYLAYAGSDNLKTDNFDMPFLHATKIIDIPKIITERSLIQINAPNYKDESDWSPYGTGYGSYFNASSFDIVKLQTSLTVGDIPYISNPGPDNDNSMTALPTINWENSMDIITQLPNGVGNMFAYHEFNLLHSYPSFVNIDFTLNSLFTLNSTNELSNLSSYKSSTLLIPDVSSLAIGDVIKENDGTLNFLLMGHVLRNSIVTVDFSHVPSFAIISAVILNEGSDVTNPIPLNIEKVDDFISTVSFTVNFDTKVAKYEYETFKAHFSFSLVSDEIIKKDIYSGALKATVASYSTLGKKDSHIVTAYKIPPSALETYYLKNTTFITSIFTVKNTPSSGLTPEEIEELLNQYKDAVDKGSGNDDVYVGREETTPNTNGGFDTDVDIIIKDSGDDLGLDDVNDINDSFTENINNDGKWTVENTKPPVFEKNPSYCQFKCGAGCSLCNNGAQCTENSDCKSNICDSKTLTCVKSNVNPGNNFHQINIGMAAQVIVLGLLSVLFFY